MHPSWHTLLAEIRAVHERLPALQAFCAFPETVTAQDIPARHDPLIDAMQAEPGLTAPKGMAPLRDALQQAAPTAFWRDTYRNTGYGEVLHANFGCYEVLGRQTPLQAKGMRSFVIYQKAGFHYPWHHHPAEELYLVVAGEGEFHLDGAKPRRLGPGDTAFHASNAPHALITHESPVIAYVLWRGDLETKPVWTDPEALT